MTDNRTEYIGGSDIASIMGLNRWSSPLQIWAEKTGLVKPRDISKLEHVQLGTELEDFVSRKFERETGRRVRRAPKRYAHHEHTYMRCQVDRLVTGTDELLEAKTCSAWKAKEWDDEEIPQEYYLQVMWQLGITGRKTGHIAVLIGGQKFVYKEIAFDAETFAKMVDSAARFWEMVKTGTPPMAGHLDEEVLFELNPDSTDEVAEAQDMENKIAYRQELSMHINEMKKEKDELDAQIKQAIGGRLGIKTNKYTVKWTPQESRSADTKRMKEDGIYENYTKTSATRVLRVRLVNQPTEASNG